MLKRLLCSLFLVPALVVAGCSCKKDEEEKVEYKEVEKAEVISYINKVEEDNNLIITGYDFNMTMAMPLDLFGGSVDEDATETIWPDISDNTKWEKVQMNGSMVSNNEQFEAKIVLPEENGASTVYIKGNTMYTQIGEDKYKLTLDNEEELAQMELMQQLPSTEDLMEQIAIISDAESGLKYEKAIEGSKVHYHVSGVAQYNIDEGGFQMDMEIPIDLYLTFENDKLISYKYKTFMMFVYMEIEITSRTSAIEFPTDLDSYNENSEIFEGEE